MAEDRDALIRHYEEAHDALLAAIDGIDAPQLAEPSLDGWSVADHLAHIAAWDEIRASEVARISAGYDSAWRMSGGQDDAFNEMAHELRRGFSPEQALWELETSHQRLLDAITAASERGLDASLYGEAGLLTDHHAEHAGWLRRWREDNAL